MVYSNQFPVGDKAKLGKLWYNGQIIVSNKPFRFLQWKKKQLITVGYQKELFKITY